jgi:hypothetical protein
MKVIFLMGSSVSTVPGYGLGEREIEVRSPAEAKDFSSILCVQTGSGAHPASCTVGTGGRFPGVKARPGCDADHSPPSSAETESEQGLYFLSPKRLLGVWWDIFSFLEGLKNCEKSSIIYFFQFMLHTVCGVISE